MDDKKNEPGLSYLDENLPSIAQDFYDDNRTRKILNVEDQASKDDLDLINDMINSLKKIMP